MFTGKSTVHAALLATLCLQLSAADSGNSTGNSNDTKPSGYHAVIDHPNAGTSGSPSGNGILYHNGPLMLGLVNIYYVWYGNWSVDPNALPILQYLAQNIGGSPYFAINTTYTNGSGTPVANMVAFAGSTNDNYSQGTTLSDSGVFAVASHAITSGSLPLDTNGVYFVLTSPDVKESSGFITQYCAWHSYGMVNGSPIKFAFVGDAATQGLGACAEQTAHSPNGDVGADAMASVLIHELEESVTDPLLNAWYDSQGNENADKCAWTFGTTYTTANGSVANMKLGGRDYLIQRNWVNASGGYCALALLPSITSVSPNSGAPGATVPVNISGSNLTNGTVTLSGTGVTATVLSSSANQITASLAIASGAATGARSLTVKTVGGTSAASAFTITAAPNTPTLSSISPSSGAQGTSVSVTLTGTNLVSPATINIAGTGVSATNVTLVSGTSITATFVIAVSAATGAHNVSVTTTNGTTATLPFNVTPPPPPTLSSIGPSSGAQGSSVNVTLTGTNFIGSASLNISGTGITASNVTIANATSITATLTIAATATAGAYAISVTTPGGTSATQAFTVNAASTAPTLTSMTPSSGHPSTVVAVSLFGTNFTSQTGVRLSGGGAAKSNVVYVSPTQINVTFTFNATVALGGHNVYVTNSAGNSNILVFTVN
ncbi:MAG TPA: IPT/TIG domain-containing protein [Bryobacteraceae bacterium]|nr:IPT/TIG domain-containing protein [Bryobacteraceae bacterium]